MSSELLENTRIVLVRPRHPSNIGAAARAMLTMGLSRLTLVSPETVFTGRAGERAKEQMYAQAAHATPVLDQLRIVATLDDATAGCGWVVGASARPRHLGDEPLTPWDMAQQALALPNDRPPALLFGPERTGLTNEELNACHAVVRIPADARYSSLNLAQAVQVLAYELRRAARPEVPQLAAKRDHPWYAPPRAEEIERFYEHLQRVLLATGFLDPRNPRMLMRRLRTFFNRARPDRNELNILRGILKTVEKPKKRKGVKSADV